MANRPSKRLIAATATAITTVYLAGYLLTQPAADQIAAAEGRGAGIQAIQLPTTTPLPTVTPAPTVVRGSPIPFTPPSNTGRGVQQPSTLPPTAVPQAPAANVAYHDGTYIGLGISRRGNVEVTITIKNGHIESTIISNSSTQYPISRIASLPGQVVARQSDQVDMISGATLSARAFQDATRQALAKSQQAV